MQADAPVFVDPQSTEEYSCAICLGIVKDCMETSCGHIYCAICIQGVHTCPTCRSPLAMGGVRKSHFVQRKIDHLMVFCPNKRLGCGEQIPFVRTQAHLGVCNFGYINCPACAQKLLRKDLEQHSREDCYHRLRPCEACGVQHKNSAMPAHKNVCDDVIIPCPNACNDVVGSTLRAKRKVIQSHVRAECPLQIVHCSFHGCNLACHRQQLAQHHQASWEHHLSAEQKERQRLAEFLQQRGIYEEYTKWTMNFSLLIRFRREFPGCRTMVVDVNPSTTVEEVIQDISLRTAVPESRLQLHWPLGRILPADISMRDLSIQGGMTIEADILLSPSREEAARLAAAVEASKVEAAAAAAAAELAAVRSRISALQSGVAEISNVRASQPSPRASPNVRASGASSSARASPASSSQPNASPRALQPGASVRAMQPSASARPVQVSNSPRTMQPSARPRVSSVPSVRGRVPRSNAVITRRGPQEPS